MLRARVRFHGHGGAICVAPGDTLPESTLLPVQSTGAQGGVSYYILARSADKM